MNKDYAIRKAKEALKYYLDAEYGDRAVEVCEIVDLIIAAAVAQALEEVAKAFDEAALEDQK